MSNEETNETEKAKEQDAVLLSVRVYLHRDARVEVSPEPDPERPSLLGDNPPLNQLLMMLRTAASEIEAQAIAQASLQLQMEAAQQIQKQQQDAELRSKLTI